MATYLNVFSHCGAARRAYNTQPSTGGTILKPH